jgi:hypothetical protein
MEGLSSLVFGPAGLGGQDVFALPLLGATCEQDDQRLAILSEVNPIAGPEIHFQLGYTTTDALHVRAIALRKPVQGKVDSRLGLSIKRIEPLLKWNAAIPLNE